MLAPAIVVNKYILFYSILFRQRQKSVTRQYILVAKKGAKEGAAAGALTLTLAHYAGANQNALIVELVIILFA